MSSEGLPRTNGLNGDPALVDTLIFEDLSKINPDDTIGLYLKEAAHHSILTPEEELVLVNRLDQGRTYQDGKITLEDMRLTDDARDAYEDLVRHNIRMVIDIAKRYNGRGVPFLDIISEGNIGLLKGVAKFDPKLGFRLSTYATWWIRQSITRYIADNSRTKRLPVHYGDFVNRIFHVKTDLMLELGHEPSFAQIGAAMGRESKEIEQAFIDASSPVYIDAPKGAGDRFDDDLVGDYIEDKSAEDAPSSSEDSEIQKTVRKLWMNITNERHRFILGLRYGFIDGKSRTLDGVAEIMGVTRENIRQIEANALRRLRANANKIKSQLD